MNGACQKSQCVDSDNGKEPFTQGIVYGDLSPIGREGTVGKAEDFCIQPSNGAYPFILNSKWGNYISQKSLIKTCENDCAVYELSCDPDGVGVVYGDVMPCAYGCSNGQCKPFSITPELVDIEVPEKMESSTDCPKKHCSVDEAPQCINNKKYTTEKCTSYIKKDNQCEEYVYSNSISTNEVCGETQSICQGCQLDGETCLPVGTRLAKENVGFFCDITKKVNQQKHNNEQCQNSYECDSNACKSNICKLLCDGCLDSDNVCLPIGTRTEVEFCDVDSSFKSQKIETGQCNNNFECGSNLCVDNQCIEKGVFTKILGWFKNLF